VPTDGIQEEAVMSTRTISISVILLAAAAAAAQGPSSGYPPGINPQSGNRFPVIQRADLDEAGKKIFDEQLAPGRTALGGGPVALRMYLPVVADHMHTVNQYLRSQAGLTPRVVELTILATTRELDARFEWNGHEAAALKAGLSPAIIDVVRFRKPLTGVDEKDAAVIALAREAVGKRKVGAETFARADRLFGKTGVVAMAALMGEYSAAAILLAVADQQLAPGQKALLPVP
jgi:4-carboxymuconolactone decarboxylase